MDEVKVAFHIIESGEEIPANYSFVKCHMKFDVKIENFRRKAQLVAEGHVVYSPLCLTYSSVMSRESVRIALTLAALNDLEVKTGDIRSTCLTAPIQEKT